MVANEPETKICYARAQACVDAKIQAVFRTLRAQEERSGDEE